MWRILSLVCLSLALTVGCGDRTEVHHHPAKGDGLSPAQAQSSPQGVGSGGGMQGDDPPPSGAMVGTGSGGGGDVYICYDSNNNIIDMESLDIWRGMDEWGLSFDRKLLGHNPFETESKDGYMEIVRATLDHLKTLDPVLSDKLWEDAQAFSVENLANSEESILVDRLAEKDDSGLVTLPNVDDGGPCDSVKKQRVIWQNDFQKMYQRKYNIYKSFWLQSPARVKASLVLHEVIWNMERQNFEPESSRESQYLNAVIHSLEFLQFTPEQYVQLIEEQGEDEPWFKKRGQEFFSVTKFGVTVWLKTHQSEMEFTDFRETDGADGENLYVLKGFVGRLIEPFSYSDEKMTINIKKRGRVGFNAKGELRFAGHLDEGSFIYVNEQNPKVSLSAESRVIFLEGDHLRTISPLGGTEVVVGSHSWKMMPVHNGYTDSLYIRPDRSIQKLTADVCEEVAVSVNGEDQTIQGRVKLDFDSAGEITRVYDLDDDITALCGGAEVTDSESEVARNDDFTELVARNIDPIPAGDSCIDYLEDGTVLINGKPLPDFGSEHASSACITEGYIKDQPDYIYSMCYEYGELNISSVSISKRDGTNKISLSEETRRICTGASKLTVE